MKISNLPIFEMTGRQNNNNLKYHDQNGKHNNESVYR